MGVGGGVWRMRQDSFERQEIGAGNTSAAHARAHPREAPLEGAGVGVSAHSTMAVPLGILQSF